MAADFGKTIAELERRALERAVTVSHAVEKILRAVEVEADGDTIKPGQTVTIKLTVPELCAICETLSGK